MRRALLIAAACLGLLSAPALAAAATLGPVFVGGPGTKSKPRKIAVGAKGVWEGLRWRDWGGREAVARGVYDIAGFAGEPGTGYRSRIYIRVYRRRTCPDGDRVYTRVRWRVHKPIGGRRVFRERFSTCS
jgi:hypothetical protein